jgi:hypothetical protein
MGKVASGELAKVLLNMRKELCQPNQIGFLTRPLYDNPIKESVVVYIRATSLRLWFCVPANLYSRAVIADLDDFEDARGACASRPKKLVVRELAVSNFLRIVGQAVKIDALCRKHTPIVNQLLDQCQQFAITCTRNVK